MSKKKDTKLIWVNNSSCILKFFKISSDIIMCSQISNKVYFMAWLILSCHSSGASNFWALYEYHDNFLLQSIWASPGDHGTYHICII